jgi:hypothetical protein
VPSLQLLGTAWTVWKMARRRLGPVGAVIATAVVIGGMVYLRPWLAQKFPALATAVSDAPVEERSSAA